MSDINSVPSAVTKIFLDFLLFSSESDFWNSLWFKETQKQFLCWHHFLIVLSLMMIWHVTFTYSRSSDKQRSSYICCQKVAIRISSAWARTVPLHMHTVPADCGLYRSGLTLNPIRVLSQWVKWSFRVSGFVSPVSPLQRQFSGSITTDTWQFLTSGLIFWGLH